MKSIIVWTLTLEQKEAAIAEVNKLKQQAN